MIATLVVFGGQATLPRLAVLLAWGSVAGSALQFAVQVPVVLRVAPGMRFRGRARCDGRNLRSTCATSSATSCRSFVSRGVVQISAYIDTLLASLLPTGAVTGLTNAQLLYTLPVSLFGMSVSAAELPAMSAMHRARPRSDGRRGPGARCPAAALDAGLRQIAFFVVPSAMAFLALGDVIAAALLRRPDASAARTRSTCGAFSPGRRSDCSRRRWAGCTPRPTTRCATRGRRCGMRSSASRSATVLGYLFAIPLPRWLGVPAMWGAAGLTVSAGLRAGSRCCCCAGR